MRKLGCELAMRLLILVNFMKLLYIVIYLEQAWICLLTRPIPVIGRPHHDVRGGGGGIKK